MKKIILLRGLPGCNKFQTAERLKAEFTQENPTLPEPAILRPQDYFSDKHYRPNLVKKAHTWNQDRCNTLMQAAHPLIIINATNLTAKEMAPYAQHAAAHGYTLTLMQPSHPDAYNPKLLIKRCTYRIDLKKLQHMRDIWEDITAEQLMKRVMNSAPAPESHPVHARRAHATHTPSYASARRFRGSRATAAIHAPQRPASTEPRSNANQSELKKKSFRK